MHKLLALLVLAVGLAFLLGVLALIRRHGFRAIFYPPVFLVIFYGVFFLAPSVIALWFDSSLVYRYVADGYRPGSWLGAQAYALLLILISAGVSSLLFPIRDFLNYQERAVRRQHVEMTNSGLILYLALFYLLPTASMAFLILKFGGAGYEDYMLDRTASRKGLGYLIMPSLWLAIAITVLFFEKLVLRKDTRFFLFALALFLAYTAAHLYLGSKSRGLAVAVYSLLAFLFYRSVHSEVGVGKIILSVTFIISISFIGLRFGDVRESVTRGISLDQVESRTEKSMLFSKFNAFGAIENTVWLMENMRPDEASYGANFLAIVTGPIPRVIWPDKPVGGGPQLRNMISPGSYDIVSGSRLTSYSPGIIAESYMAFWVFGPVLVGPVFGIFLAFFGRMLKFVRSPLGLVTWVICLLKLVYILTGEVFSTVSSVGQTTLPLFFLVAIAQILSFRIYRNAS